MSNGTGAAGAGAAGAAAAAIARAIKASGAIVHLEPEEFQKIIDRSYDAVVVAAKGGWFSVKYMYLICYKGLFFYTKSDMPLGFPEDIEFVTARKIWIP
jgi:hypothetical protein